MSSTVQSRSYNAKRLDASKRKQLALDAIDSSQPIQGLADTNQVSRKFVYQQRDKAVEAVNDAFEPPAKDKKVLFYLPVTSEWLCQLILCIMLYCRGCYRGVQKLLVDVFDPAKPGEYQLIL